MKGILIAVTVETMRVLKDGSVAINLQTQEISPGKVGEIFDLRNKACYAYFSASQIDNNEAKLVDGLEPELRGKTPSLRLRNVLYVAWQQNPEGYQDSESYYRAKMEGIINGIKAELNP